MSEENNNIEGFTPGEQKLLVALMQNIEGEMQFNFEAVAATMGYKSGSVARVRWNQIKAKKITPNSQAGGIDKKSPNKKSDGPKKDVDNDKSDGSPKKRGRKPKDAKAVKEEQDAAIKEEEENAAVETTEQADA